MTDEGLVKNYLGVNVERKQSSTTLSQSFLIQRILEVIGRMENANTKPTPSLNKEILNKDLDRPEQKQAWSYRSVVGKFELLSQLYKTSFAMCGVLMCQLCSQPKIKSRTSNQTNLQTFSRNHK